MENKKINIAELLKDSPRGMKLYSPLCGECVFDSLNMGTIICKKQNTQEITFTSEGYYMLPVFDNCECMIFPSKDQRDWSKFQRPFVDGDILACNQVGHKNPTTYIYYHNKTKYPMYYIALIGDNELKIHNKYNSYVLSHALFSINENTIRFATEEERQKLFDAIKENGYNWNAETKTLEEIKPNKEETTKEKLEQIIAGIPKGYEFVGINDDNKIVLTKKQSKYPTTYKECCKVLGYKLLIMPINILAYNNTSLSFFHKLIFCRNTYWEIAGKEMGLGKAWKPKSDNEELYYIQNYNKQIIKGLTNTTFNKTLFFPTEEMRDTFYENFKDLIESCKELL